MEKNNDPIFKRIKTIIPPLDEITRQLAMEHAATERHRQLILVILASLVEIGEHISQSTMDMQDVSHSMADLEKSQDWHQNMMEKVADKNVTARTIVQNLEMWLAEDPASIAEFLGFVNPVRVAEAAQSLDPERIDELIAALSAAGDET